MEKKLTTNKQKAEKLGRQAQGILTKVVSMIEKDTYCPEVIQQIAAVVGLLRSAERELLVGHLNHCLEIKIKENKEQTIAELLKIYNLSK